MALSPGWQVIRCVTLIPHLLSIMDLNRLHSSFLTSLQWTDISAPSCLCCWSCVYAICWPVRGSVRPRPWPSAALSILQQVNTTSSSRCSSPVFTEPPSTSVWTKRWAEWLWWRYMYYVHTVQCTRAVCMRGWLYNIDVKYQFMIYLNIFKMDIPGMFLILIRDGNWGRWGESM